MVTGPVDAYVYLYAMADARNSSELIATNTIEVRDLPSTARYFLSVDGKSGYGIDSVGTLIGLFSLVKGRGRPMVVEAVERGARSLNCFDGYLPGLYGSAGFVEYAREPNWVPGEPDLVYMAHPSYVGLYPVLV